MKIRVYLSGPITGLSEEEYTRRFATAEQHYRTAGYEVVNPVTIGQELRRGNPEVTYADYMAADLEAMRDCTHIALLEGWENSPGAQCEKREALKLGLEIMQYRENRRKKMKQYCRYCAFCFQADENEFRCSAKINGQQLYMTRKQINRAKTCPEFALSELGDVVTGKQYQPKQERQEDNSQPELF